MKKKHLRSLNTLEKWLNSEGVMSEKAQNALEIIRGIIESVPEKELTSTEELPPPAEIADDPMAVALYSDGGCRGNPGPGAYAYLIQTHDGTILGEGVEYEALTTNNRMELSGIIQGLKELEEILPKSGRDSLLTKILVMTDSKYVVDGMKSWVQGWKARGWKKADNKAPENLELWQELDQLRNQFMQVEWVWVRGHAGHPQNEYCDKKANEVMDAHSS